MGCRGWLEFGITKVDFERMFEWLRLCGFGCFFWILWKVDPRSWF